MSTSNSYSCFMNRNISMHNFRAFSLISIFVFAVATLSVRKFRKCTVKGAPRNYPFRKRQCGRPNTCQWLVDWSERGEERESAHIPQLLCRRRGRAPPGAHERLDAPLRGGRRGRTGLHGAAQEPHRSRGGGASRKTWQILLHVSKS